MATEACDLAAALQQIEATIRDFERRAGDDAQEQDPAFQKSWDQAVQTWWELAEAFQAIDGTSEEDGALMVQRFVEGTPLRAEF